MQLVVLVSVPGAFTPGCHVTHIPPYVEKAKELKAKGADVIAFVAANDPFVMSAWGRVVGAKDEVCLTFATFNFKLTYSHFMADSLPFRS